MKKVLSAFGVVSAALVLLGAPVSAQTPANITATITAAPTNPTAGTNVIVTGVFSIPSLSSTSAQVSISTSGGGAPILVSFTPGLSSCTNTANAVLCTWSTPDSAAPQTLVIEVPTTASGITFNASAGPPGQTTVKATTSVTVVQPTTTTTTAATTTVAPPPTEAPTTTVAPTTTAAGTLPATGSNSQAPLVLAIAALALGALLVGSARVLRSRS